ncbi:MAG: hemin-degrading factor [Rhodospirillales bacterium]|nr:hemin-degrading factor [Rhodospirillales bacterium]MBO6785709.1 hemin-degrading factor [Rhodospirillales bacterium]
MDHLAIETDGNNVLLQSYLELKTKNPRLFARDAARQLGISEGELLASRCGRDAVRLDGNWHELVGALSTLGRVMCLTRNDCAVHERKGSYVDVRVREHTGAAIGPELDLRYDFRHWHFGFVLTDVTEQGTRESLQIFDIDGTAVHKIYKTEETSEKAWTRLVAERRAEDQSAGQKVMPRESRPEEASDASIDVEGLRQAWRGMKNTHQFPAMLRTYGVSRPQCFRLAGAEFAEKLGPDAIQLTLKGANANGLTLMIFVVNPGATQIHTGVPGNLKQTGDWFNVLDPDFNLHLLIKGIQSAWIVRKRYDLGTSRSIEAYDEDGEPILWIFGKRNADGTEPEAWRDFVESLPVNG